MTRDKLMHDLYHRVWLWISLLLLSACTAFVDQEQPQHIVDLTVILQAESSVGQTFVAHHACLNGVDVWLEPGSTKGDIRLHLRTDPQSDIDLVTADLPLRQVNQAGFYHFSFAPLLDSHNHYYYFFLEIGEADHVFIGAGTPEAYANGSLYRDHQPADAQMAFRLTYNWSGIVIGGIQTLLQAVGALILSGILYGVPGWALLIVLQRYGGPAVRHWTEGVGVAAGLSLALYPCLMLWTYLLGLRLGAVYAWLPVLLGFAILVWHYRPWKWRLGTFRTFSQICIKKISWPDLVFIGVVGIISLQRFAMIRGLELPLWMDSIQHTMIVQHLLEEKGIFQSWRPYAPYQTFSQQFGFHTLVAVWAWLTGSAAPQAVLWAGQALNVLAVLSLYPLAYRIRGVWAGVFAMLLAGVGLQFPAFYTNWGRYPQMCGQALLLFAVWWGWCAQKAEGKLWPWVLGGGLTFAGMTLTYYRMVFHYGTFILASLLIFAKATHTFTKRRYWLCLLGTVIFGGGIAFPWLFRIMTQSQVSAIARASTSQFPFQNLVQMGQQVSITWPFMHALWIFVGSLLAIWVNEAAILPVVWAWLLMALPILRMFPLPGVSIIQSFTISTSLYMPRALVWGTLLGHWGEPLWAKKWSRGLATVVLFVVVLYRCLISLQWVERSYDFATWPDIRAAQWVANHLPSNALIVIRGTLYSDGTGSQGEETAWWTAVVGPHALGMDGGSWLSVLSRRMATIPLPYLLQSEAPEQAGYTEAVNRLTQRLLEVPVTSADGIAALCQFPLPITHIYLGQRQVALGKLITGPTLTPLVDVLQLQQSPAFRLLYQQDQVRIFEFDRTFCR